MPDNPLIVALLKEYAGEKSITRPEVARVVGMTFGQIAGLHTRHKDEIGQWPRFDTPEMRSRKKNRRCQFPVGMPGTDAFHLCGKILAPGHSLLCEEHERQKWVPSCQVVPLKK